MFACLTAILLLTGCARTEQEENYIVLTEPAATETTIPTTQPKTESTTQPDATEPTTEPPVIDRALPVLSIVTKKQGDNALDFVTKPVAPHVMVDAAERLSDKRKMPVPYNAACSLTLTDTDGTVLLDAAQADVRVRGNWTSYYEKKPMRIEFADKQNLLEMRGGEKLRSWVLLAEYKDPSLLRSQTSLTIARNLLTPDDLYVADSQLIEVEINGEYWGVYLLTEQQEVNKHRIDLTKPGDDQTDTKIGYLLEYDGYCVYEEPLHWFEISYADNAALRPYDGYDGAGRWLHPKNNVGFSIKSKITSQAQRDFIANYMDLVYRILYAAAYQKEAYQFNADYTAIEKCDLTPEQAVEQVIDVQSLADMYVLCELVCDADLNWSSFYMDVDFGENGSKKLVFEAPWDFDSAMGNKERCPDGWGFYAANRIPDIDEEADTLNPWLTVLVYEDWFQQRVKATWTKASDAGIFEQAIAAIGEDTAEYADAFRRNCERWNTDCKEEETLGCRTQRQAADSLKKWLTARVDFLGQCWYSPEALATEPETTEPESTEPETNFPAS